MRLPSSCEIQKQGSERGVALKQNQLHLIKMVGSDPEINLRKYHWKQLTEVINKSKGGEGDARKAKTSLSKENGNVAIYLCKTIAIIF